MSDKPKIPLGEALPVADEIFKRFSPFCERIAVAGSIRRNRPYVGDIEILFIPRLEVKGEGLFSEIPKEFWDLGSKALDWMVDSNYLTKRLSKTGHPAWGKEIKLAVHAASGVSVDFFSTDPDRWPVALAVRTGGKVSNTQVCMAAIRHGWHFEPFGKGFSGRGPNRGRYLQCYDERDVFEFVGLPFLPPEKRQ